MKQSQNGTNFIKDQLDSNLNYELTRNKPTDFTRKRKIGPKELIIYNMNKKGLSSKMEEYHFFKITGYESISTPGMLKQREKLNPEIFRHLNDGLLNVYYKDCKEEMKLYNGYLLTATDGSEFEIPNTKTSKESFGSTTSGYKKTENVARAKVSIVIDILNKFVLDICIAKHRTNDMKLSKIHRNQIISKFRDYKIINIKDRGYTSLEDMYYSINNNIKFIQRLDSKTFSKEISQMKSNDEEIEIQYEYNRIKYLKKTAPELYQYYLDGNTIKLRAIKINLETETETEILLTNLDFTYEEMKELYKLRWSIESTYHQLKENLKIETISSGKEVIVKQEILSQMLVYNIAQSHINVAESKITQEKYKHEMKINHNMAMGLLKDYFIYIIMEEKVEKRLLLMDEFEQLIAKYLCPIRKNRKYKRNKQIKNKHHINKRKTF